MRARHPFAAVAAVVVLVLVPACPLHGNDWVFSDVSGGHAGAVSAVLGRGSTVISAGEDGFLEVRDLSGDGTVRRFQVSPFRIVAMAGRPGRSEVSIVGTDGRGLFRVSAWDYVLRRNVFTAEFRTPVVHVSYSMEGSFVMVGLAGAPGLVLLGSSDGTPSAFPPLPPGTVALAVTGRAERNMMAYLSSGFISYRDLETGAETHRFAAPANLSSPALFAGNRFLAGVGAQGLTVVDAVSGGVVESDASVPAGSLLSSAGDVFYALVQRPGSAELRRLAVDPEGSLVMLAALPLPPQGGGGRFTAMDASGGTVVLGTSDGGIVLVEEGIARPLATGGRVRIADAAVSGSVIAFIAENGTVGFIPLDHSELTEGGAVRIESNDGNRFGRVTPFVPEDGPDGRFVFWQDRGIGTPPTILPTDPETAAHGLEGISFRFPLRSVASHAGRVMFLDSAGNLSVVSPFAEGRPFAFSSVGLMDADFADDRRLILGRSAVAGNTPFLSLDVVTGETVPLTYPARAGVMVQRGSSGEVYAVAVAPRPEGTVTAVIRVDPANIADSPTLAEFPGEHDLFSLAETPYGIAVNVGGEGGAIHYAGGTRTLGRTPGFPRRLLEGGRYLVSLDGDGNLAWHDGRDGGLLAVFRLRPDGWTLQSGRGTAEGGF